MVLWSGGKYNNNNIDSINIVKVYTSLMLVFLHVFFFFYIFFTHYVLKTISVHVLKMVHRMLNISMSFFIQYSKDYIEYCMTYEFKVLILVCEQSNNRNVL